jgi:hypothetical protein
VACQQRLQGTCSMQKHMATVDARR